MYCTIKIRGNKTEKKLNQVKCEKLINVIINQRFLKFILKSLTVMFA
jgi:hypothetical protein